MLHRSYVTVGHINFERVVSFALPSLLNDFLWLQNRFLKSPSAVPRYTLFGLSGDNTVHWYIMSVTWHWPFRGHLDFTLHLHGFNSLTSLLITFLLCDFIMLDMFCVQTFTVFLLKIAWSLLEFWKCWSIKFKNCLSTLVETLRWIKLDDVVRAISFLFYVLFVCIN